MTWTRRTTAQLGLVLSACYVLSIGANAQAGQKLTQSEVKRAAQSARAVSDYCFLVGTGREPAGALVARFASAQSRLPRLLRKDPDRYHDFRIFKGERNRLTMRQLVAQARDNMGDFGCFDIGYWNFQRALSTLPRR